MRKRSIISRNAKLNMSLQTRLKRVVHGGKICTNTNERDRLVLKWSDLMPGIVNDRRITFSDRRSFELFEARLSKGVMNNVTRETLDKKTKNITISRRG